MTARILCRLAEIPKSKIDEYSNEIESQMSKFVGKSRKNRKYKDTMSGQMLIRLVVSRGDVTKEKMDEAGLRLIAKVNNGEIKLGGS